MATIVYSILQNDDAGCDITKQLESCQAGYCCARDEFLPELVYCKRIGRVGQPCTTKPSESDCPCGPGLYCKPNVQSTFVSFYGKCAVMRPTDMTMNAQNLTDAISQNVTMNATSESPTTDITGDVSSVMPALSG